MEFDTRLDFNLHLKNLQNKVNKTIGLLRKLQDTLTRPSLITIFKSFIRPIVDYGDIIYDRAYNTSFHQNIESIQYNAALAITGAVRGTSREKLYQELGFESLQQRRWYRKLCCLFKIINNESPIYPFQLILLFGDNTLINSSNTFILNSTTEYIISTQRFEGSILTPV